MGVRRYLWSSTASVWMLTSDVLVSTNWPSAGFSHKLGVTFRLTETGQCLNVTVKCFFSHGVNEMAQRVKAFVRGLRT